MVHAGTPDRQDFQIGAGRQHILRELHGGADVDYGVCPSDADDGRVVIGRTVEVPGGVNGKLPCSRIVWRAGKDGGFVVRHHEEGEGFGLGHGGVVHSSRLSARISRTSLACFSPSRPLDWIPSVIIWRQKGQETPTVSAWVSRK